MPTVSAELQGAQSRGQSSNRAREIRPLAPALGAEVLGIDLSQRLSPEEFATVRRALADYHVIVMRDQTLTKQNLIDFSAMWGQLGEHIKRGDTRDGIREVHILSNADENGKPIGFHPELGSMRLHTDKSYMPKPAMATVLYGFQVPDEGGDTLFANMYAVYDALPDEVKEKIDDLYAVHALEWSRRAVGYSITEEEKHRAPPVRRPLVRRDPETGRKSVFCGLHAWKIDGWSEEESRKLIDYLNDFAGRPEFQYRHKWRQKDVLMWDNRCTLHAATPFDTARDVRTMYRTIIEEAPLRGNL